jgi:hypothetical protein
LSHRSKFVSVSLEHELAKTIHSANPDGSRLVHDQSADENALGHLDLLPEIAIVNQNAVPVAKKHAPLFILKRDPVLV